MRKYDVTVKDFRDLASELASLLTYEATKDLETEIRNGNKDNSGLGRECRS